MATGCLPTKKARASLSSRAMARTTLIAFQRLPARSKKLHPVSLLLDGEVVVFDSKSISRFELFQQGKGEPVYATFDCLFVDGEDLRQRSLSERRTILEGVIPSNGVLLLSHRLASNGLDAFRIAKHRGYEGLVAKDLSSPYVGRRSRSWLKVKVHQEDEFVIAGYTAPEGARKYFGALLLGVGTGFDATALAALYRRFQPFVSSAAALVDPPRERNVTYLRPQLIAQISYQELTTDRKLRRPVYLGLRDDKSARDVTLRRPEPSA
jgi:bifunctional non-homologous end joining protein LigD